MSNLQPNWCLKFVFQKVDQHAGGKWLIHDTKWHHVESDILKEGPGTETSWEVRDYRTPNT